MQIYVESQKRGLYFHQKGFDGRRMGIEAYATTVNNSFNVHAQVSDLK